MKRWTCFRSWRAAALVVANFVASCSSSSRAPDPAGDAGSAGAADANDQATLRPPLGVVDTPEIVGASPVPCGGRPSPEPAVVRACLLASSCSPFPPVAALSDCIAQALPASGLYPACALGAQSCAEMDACLGTGFYSDPCPELAAVEICVGTKIVACGLPRYYRDCAKSGAACSQYSANDDGNLDSADCSVAPTCTTPSDVYVCNGSKRVRCQHGIAFGEDCAAQGMACVAGPEGAVCALRPAACSQPGGSCDASGAGTYCGADGRALQLDCPRLGFTCREAPERTSGVACEEPSCSHEDAAQCFEECDGPLAHLCLGGQRFSVDCRAYGLQSCILESNLEGGDHARCGYD